MREKERLKIISSAGATTRSSMFTVDKRTGDHKIIALYNILKPQVQLISIDIL